MTLPSNLFRLPIQVIERDGPFAEFKQDVAYVTVELADGVRIENVLVLYPDRIIGVKGSETLTFDPTNVVRVFQTDSDLQCRNSSSDTFFASQ